MRQLTIVVTAISLGVTSSLAGQASRTAERRQAILNYQLTLPKANELITAMDEMTRYVVSLPDVQERMVKSMKMSPEQLRAQLEKDPKAIAILKKHGLTSQDYLVGVPALRMALMAAQGLANNPNITASPANIAFAKAHLAELKPKLDAVDGIRPRP
jgi:hypothetical protein